MAAPKPSSSNKSSGKEGGKETSSTGRWEKEVDQIVAKWYPPTRIQGKPANQPLSEQSFFDIFELDLNRDNKEKSLLISGNDAQIALQASMIRALDQLYGSRGLGYFDFQEWAEDFCDGFRGASDGASDALKKVWQKEFWPGIDKDSRPRIVELNFALKSREDKDYHVVQFFPNRKQLDKWYLLSGTYPEIRQQIQNLWNRPPAEAQTGGWLGYPYEEFVYKNPAPLQIQIHMRLVQQPPWEQQAVLETLGINKRYPPRPRITIPNVDKTKLTWAAVKAACGGANGYTWGRFYASCRMGDTVDEKIGKGGSLTVYASSEAEAISRAEAFAALSKSKILTITTGEEQQDKGQRAIDSNMKKPSLRVYPAWFTIFNYKLVAATLKGPGTGTTAGRKLEKQRPIELWMPAEPPGTAQLIADLTSSDFG